MKTKDEKFDIEASVDYMQKYWSTYKEQMGWENYDQEMFLHDALYGVGVALDPKKYRFANGFEKFKVFLHNRFESLIKTLFLTSLKRGR